MHATQPVEDVEALEVERDERVLIAAVVVDHGRVLQRQLVLATALAARDDELAAVRGGREVARVRGEEVDAHEPLVRQIVGGRAAKVVVATQLLPLGVAQRKLLLLTGVLLSMRLVARRLVVAVGRQLRVQHEEVEAAESHEQQRHTHRPRHHLRRRLLPQRTHFSFRCF